MSKIVDAIIAACAVGILLLSGFALVGPNGSAQAAWENLKDNRAARTLVRQHWSRLAMPLSRLDASGEPIALVEFSDYECPYCRRMNAAVDTAASRGRIGISYRHYPLPSHPAARSAALAAICAEGQGRFLEMHTRLMTTDEWREDQRWVREASAAGVKDTIAFATCIASKKAAMRLEEDITLARALGISSTPTFVGRKGMRKGALPADVLLEVVKIE